MKSAIAIQNLTKTYKELTAFDDISFTVPESTFLGPNGSGKSTTINCILSLLSYDSGEITIFGKKCHQTPSISKDKSALCSKMSQSLMI